MDLLIKILIILLVISLISPFWIGYYGGGLIGIVVLLIVLRVLGII